MCLLASSSESVIFWLLSANIKINICKDIILRVVLCGYERGSHPIEEYKLVFVDRVLRRIFGSKREELEGGWRRLHHEELHNFTRHQIL
jgi:hypothetical protein